MFGSTYSPRAQKDVIKYRELKEWALPSYTSRVRETLQICCLLHIRLPMPALYSPPYDSPIEDLFAYNAIKYLADDVELTTQVPINTICGRFVLDFVAVSPTAGKIAIECDGKEFHEESRDEWRDAMILGCGFVDVIYRLRGSDIHYHIEDLLYLISRRDPNVISERGAINLASLATAEAKSFIAKGQHNEIHCIQYSSADGEQGRLRMEVRRTAIPAGQRRFWQAAYAYAQSIGGGKLDDVIASYRSGT